MIKLFDMSNYKDLEIYKLAFDHAIKVHNFSLKLPSFELYEQGSQIRRSSKSIKDQISEGYGRRRYKADFIKFLTYSQASCDETNNHLETIKKIYPELNEVNNLLEENIVLGKRINKFIQYVDFSWKSIK